MGTAKREKKEKAIAESKVTRKRGETPAEEKKSKVTVKTDIIPVPEEARSLSRVFNILAVLNPLVSKQIHSVLSGDDILVTLYTPNFEELKPILLSTLSRVIMARQENILANMTFELKQTMSSNEALCWIRAINNTIKDGGYELITKRIQKVSV